MANKKNPKKNEKKNIDILPHCRLGEIVDLVKCTHCLKMFKTIAGLIIHTKHQHPEGLDGVLDRFPKVKLTQKKAQKKNQ